MLGCPPGFDIPLLVGNTERLTADNIVKYLKKNKPDWGYLPVNQNARLTIEYAKTPDQAAGYLRIKHGIAQKHNKEAARALYATLGNRGYVTRAIPPRKLKLIDDRKREFGPISRPACVLIRDRKPSLVFILARKGWHLTDEELAFYNWLCKRPYATTDFAGIPTEFIDLSADEFGERKKTIILEESLPNISDENALELTQRFLAGFVLAINELPEEVLIRRERMEAVDSTLPLFEKLP